MDFRFHGMDPVYLILAASSPDGIDERLGHFKAHAFGHDVPAFGIILFTVKQCSVFIKNSTFHTLFLTVSYISEKIMHFNRH